MTLWLGPRSLIQGQLHFYRESYRQFDFVNIQAIVVRRTARGAWYGVMIAALMTLFGWAAWFVDDLRAGILSAGFAVIWSLVFAFNLSRGPTCQVQLRTRLGLRDLPTLNRLRPARQAVRLIVEAVERAQGALPPDEATRQIDEFLASTDP